MAWDGTKETTKALTPIGFGLSSALDMFKVTINYIISITMEIQLHFKPY